MAKKEGVFTKLGAGFASVFFEEVEQPGEVPQQPEGQEELPSEATPVSVPPSPGGPPIGETAEMKRVVRGQLDEEVPHAYSVFMQLVKSMEEAGLAGDQRIKAALAASAAQGISPQKLLQAFDERLEEVDEYRSGFTQEVQATRASKLGELEERVRQIAAEIEEKERQIAELRERVSQLRVERDNTDEALAVERERIELLERRMNAVLDDIRTDLQAELGQAKVHITTKEGGKTS